jgi:hypothetical protein
MNIQLPARAGRAGLRAWRATLGATLLWLALVAAAGCGGGSAPAEGAVSSAQGLYAIRWESDSGSLPLNRLHTWTVYVEDNDGAPVSGAQLDVDGGMPQHDHGLPTQPQVAGEVERGVYRVEGMQFNMPGQWVMTVTVDAPLGRDEAILPVTVAP